MRDRNLELISEIDYTRFLTNQHSCFLWAIFLLSMIGPQGQIIIFSNCSFQATQVPNRMPRTGYMYHQGYFNKIPELG